MTGFGQGTGLLLSDLETAIRADEAFAAPILFTGVTQGSTVTFDIEVPDSADTAVVINLLRISSSVACRVTGYDTFSVEPSGGTVIDPESLLLDSAGVETTTVANILKNPSFTGDGVQTIDIVGGGTGGNAVGGSGALVETIVEPGRRLAYEVLNTSTGTGSFAAVFIFHEAGRLYSDA